MTTELHPASDERPSTGTEDSPAESSPAPPAAPPRGRIVAREQRRPLSGRWALGLGLVAVGACLVGVLVPFGSGLDVFGLPVAILFATTCLVAGWLLRSWWGLIAIPVVYVAVAALMRALFVVNAPPDVGVLTGRFALSVVAPAVALSAIGAAIGMYRARVTSN